MDAQQAEKLAAYEAEVEHQRRMYGPTADIPRSPYAQIGIASPTPATPINDRIRDLSGEVANAVDVLVQRRQEAATASLELAKAEDRFQDLWAQLSTLLEECRVGGGNSMGATR